MTSYEVFSEFYNVMVGDKTSRISFLQKLIEESAPNASSLLEMACGTGTLMEGLSKKYSVSGFDLSPAMINIAKQKLPQADIRVGDMVNFNIGKRFDVVLCIYDAINHLDSWEKWSATFANVSKQLKKGGLFIFDIHTIERHEWLVNSPPRSRLINGDYVFMVAGREADKFKWTVGAFKKEIDGRFSLHQDIIYETAFPLEQIKQGVSKLFNVRKIVDANNLSEENPDWRPFFVCVKK